MKIDEIKIDEISGRHLSLFPDSFLGCLQRYRQGVQIWRFLAFWEIGAGFV
jgi:hypothetical protein